jgi:lysozyme
MTFARGGGRKATDTARLVISALAAVTVVSGALTARAASTPPPTSSPRLPANLMLSASGAAFIAAYEGFSATPYDGIPPARNCTIGYGHQIHPGPCTSADFRKWGTITVRQGQALLQSDANSRFVPALRAGIPATPLTQPEFDALVDWIYNEGAAYITGNSSVRIALRASPPQYSAVPQDLMRYVLASGKKLCGLYRRRLSEVNLWSTGSYARLRPACPPGYVG